MALYISNEIEEIAMMEENPQELMIFNENSRNAIMMATDYVKGFSQSKNYFGGNKGSYRRDAAAALVSNSLDRLQETSPKLNRASTYAETVSNIVKMGYSVDEYSRMIAQAHSTDQLEDYVNLAVGVSANVISGDTGLTKDITGETVSTMNYASLNQAKAIFGDKAPRLGTVLMHSKPFYDLVGDGIGAANSTEFELFSLTTVTDIPQYPGLAFVITDAPDLVIADKGGSGVDGYISLILQPMAIIASESEPTLLNVDEANKVNSELAPESHFQYTPKLTIKGFSFTGGIDNPTEAQVKTAGNWTKIATNDKLTAGVALITL